MCDLQLAILRAKPYDVPMFYIINTRVTAFDGFYVCGQAALFSTRPNPHTLTGAIVEFPSFEDKLEDIRTSNDTRVSIENNAGITSALAGLTQATGTWDQCLQGFGVLTKDFAVCDANLYS